jgi:hypothetical protein
VSGPIECVTGTMLYCHSTVHAGTVLPIHAWIVLFLPQCEHVIVGHNPIPFPLPDMYIVLVLFLVSLALLCPVWKDERPVVGVE